MIVRSKLSALAFLALAPFQPIPIARAADAREVICHVRPGAPPSAGQTLYLSHAEALEHRRRDPGDYAGRCRTLDAAIGIDDADGDGVLDTLDNCLLDPNEDQRDTDRDGFGNACDPDFDQDGRVGTEDRLALTEAIDRGADLARVRDFDLNADGEVDTRDVEVLEQFRGLPPGPVSDSDGDGVLDPSDTCPNTAAGARLITLGCSALDVVQESDRLAAGPIDRLERLGDALAPAAIDLAAAQRTLREAAARARRGDACGARDTTRGARAATLPVAALLDRLVQDALLDSRANPVQGDEAEEDSRVAGLTMLQGRLDAANADIELVASAFDATCLAARPATFAAGPLRDAQDSLGRIVLADGKVVGLREGAGAAGPFNPGRGVRGIGFDYGDGTGLASDVGSDVGSVPAPVGQLPCVLPAFAPAQSYPPFTKAAPFLLSWAAYNQNGVYDVEAGMGIGAVAASTCSAPATWTDHLEVWITYRNDATGATVGPTALALHLEPGDWPVKLPLNVRPTQPATVTIKTYRCPMLIGSPGDCQLVKQLSYTLFVGKAGSRAFAEPDATLFNVDDQVAGDKRWSHVVNVGKPPSATWTQDAGVPLGFTSVGKRPYQNTLIEGVVNLSDTYAIRNSDYYPIHDAGGFTSGIAVSASGVTHAIGLRWPMLVGRNHGREFRYLASMPKVVRDVVDFCPSSGVNSFYRLPLASGLVVTQGQGSLSGGTHGQGYAYDMGFGCLQTIRAARAGVVWSVKESSALQFKSNCPDGCEDPDFQPPGCNPGCPEHGCSNDVNVGNSFWLLHQDGSYGQYVHFPKDGIVPQEGDVVHRGEVVGVAGTTGQSTGAHLHIAEKVNPDGESCTFSSTVGGGCTRKMLYQRVLLPDLAVQTCYEPTEGDAMVSNNKKF